MKIYTKTGDAGETSLFGGGRVGKETLRLETYGTVDELNSVIGIVRSLHPPEEIDSALEAIQNDLFVLGGELAASDAKAAARVPRIEEAHIGRLEASIDRIQTHLTPLSSFILPAGNDVAAHLHHARSVCRRTERLAVGLARTEPVEKHVLIYLNRLSDYLFVLARYANALAGVQESTWKGRA